MRKFTLGLLCVACHLFSMESDPGLKKYIKLDAEGIHKIKTPININNLPEVSGQLELAKRKAEIRMPYCFVDRTYHIVENSQIVAIFQSQELCSYGFPRIGCNKKGMVVPSLGGDELKLYNLETKECAYIFRGKKDDFNFLTNEFSPDGTILAVYFSTQNKLVLWDVEQNKEIEFIENVPLDKMRISPDNRLLAFVCLDCQPRIYSHSILYFWDIPEKKIIQKALPEENCLGIDFTVDGNYLNIQDLHVGKRNKLLEIKKILEPKVQFYSKDNYEVIEDYC